MTMGERIKALRVANGMSQAELGDKVGVKTPAIYKYENGLVVNLKSSTIAKLADALESTPAYLMGWEQISIDEYTERKKPTPVSESGPIDPLNDKLTDLLLRATPEQKKAMIALLESMQPGE